MSSLNRTFRLFVSSTFGDMKAERNALQQYVFPRLRELCQAYGWDFQVVDLRWGVSADAKTEQETMHICFEEIRRCQALGTLPNFMILIGDRYGWQPAPEEIPEGEYVQILHQLEQDGDHAAERVQPWYRLDANANPPVYRLQSQPYGTSTCSKSDLQRLLRRGVEPLHFSERALVKYTASATEQEIWLGALDVTDATEHVLAFFREIDILNGQKSLTEVDEKEKAFLDTLQDNRRTPDLAAHQRVLDLKERLRQHLGSGVYDPYKATITSGEISTEHIGHLPQTLEECPPPDSQYRHVGQTSTTLCMDAWNALSGLVLREIERAEQELPDPLQREQELHLEYGRTLTMNFQGCETILQAIQDYIRTGDPHPYIIRGACGSGKSALVARVVEQTNGQPTIVRFIGITPRSATITTFLEDLCRQIANVYDVSSSGSQEYWALVQEFQRLLAYATAAYPLILFLDGLDEFNHDHHSQLDWLPAKLPPHVRLVASVTYGDAEQRLAAGSRDTTWLDMPSLSRAEAEALFRCWLEQHGRQIASDKQRSQLEACIAGHTLPLYVKLLSIEARYWHSWEDGDQAPLPSLGHNLREMIHILIDRFSLPKHHGSVLVKRCLGYLIAVRSGVSEDELRDVLYADPERDQFAPFSKESPSDTPDLRLPMAIWLRLFFDLKPLLLWRSSENTPVLSFSNREFGAVISQDYITDEDRLDCHRKFARCLQQRDETGYARTLLELPEQRYAQARLAAGNAGDIRPLYDLADSEDFRFRQFEHFKRSEPLIATIDYALEIAAVSDCKTLIHFSLVRLGVSRELFRSPLRFFIDSTERSPDVARGIIPLIPDATYQRLAWLICAFVLSKRKQNPALIRAFVQSASQIRLPAPLAQVEVILELTRMLFTGNSMDELQATQLLKAIPVCQMRSSYLHAWKNMQGKLGALASRSLNDPVGEPVSLELLEQFSRLQAVMRTLDNTRAVTKGREALEKIVVDSLGVGSISDAYLMLAAEQFHAGDYDSSLYCINLSILARIEVPIPAIRTLGATVEAFNAQGSREMAEEQLQRARTLLHMYEVLTWNSEMATVLVDVRHEIDTSIGWTAGIWRPDSTINMIGQAAVQQAVTTGTDPGALMEILTNARHLAAQDLDQAVPALLEMIAARLNRNKTNAHALCIGVYMLAHALKNEVLVRQCAGFLAADVLRPELFYQPVSNSPDHERLLARIIDADPRLIACVVFCLRKEGRHDWLMQLLYVASRAGVDVWKLDPVIAELLRTQAFKPDELRWLTDDILGTTPTLVLPSGLGMYFFPGFMLTAGWCAMMLIAASLPGLTHVPGILFTGLLLLLSGFLGGWGDLLVWWRIRLWEKPEISRRLFQPEMFSLIMDLAALFIIAQFFRIDDPLALLGGVLGFLIYLTLETVLLFRGYLMSLLTARVVASRTLLFGVISIVLVAVFSVQTLIPASVLQGLFIAGMVGLGLYLNVLVKHIPTAAHYRTRGNPIRNSLIREDSGYARYEKSSIS